MHADAYFRASPTHLVGQDYALASAPGASRSWALVADGCSGSPHTDVGARLLAHCARQCLCQGVRPGPGRLAGRAASLVRALGLPPESLDATCLHLMTRGDEVVATALGDGVVAHQDHDGRLEVRVIEYPAGTPAYSSYAIDAGRAAAWRGQGGDAFVVRMRTGDGPWRIEATGRGLPSPWRFPIAATRLVLVATDGATAFAREGDGSLPVEVEAVLEPLFSRHCTTGRFMARRVRRLLGRVAADRGWAPHDDVAFAGIACEPR